MFICALVFAHMCTWLCVCVWLHTYVYMCASLCNAYSKSRVGFLARIYCQWYICVLLLLLLIWYLYGVDHLYVGPLVSIMFRLWNSIECCCCCCGWWNKKNENEKLTRQIWWSSKIWLLLFHVNKTDILYGEWVSEWEWVEEWANKRVSERKRKRKRRDEKIPC